jgi:type III secretion protein V
MESIAASILEISGLAARPGCAIVASMDVRRYVRKMVERRATWLQVYSFQELSGHVELHSLGRAVI